MMVLELPDSAVFKTYEFFESGHSFLSKKPRQIFKSSLLIVDNFREMAFKKRRLYLKNIFPPHKQNFTVHFSPFRKVFYSNRNFTLSQNLYLLGYFYVSVFNATPLKFSKNTHWLPVCLAHFHIPYQFWKPYDFILQAHQSGHCVTEVHNCTLWLKGFKFPVSLQLSIQTDGPISYHRN